jgi:hypothetical protein
MVGIATATLCRSFGGSLKIFADGADFDSIVKLSSNPLVKGFEPGAQGWRTDFKKFGRRCNRQTPRGVNRERTSWHEQRTYRYAYDDSSVGGSPCRCWR